MQIVVINFGKKMGDSELEKKHTKDAIHENLSLKKEYNYLGDAILGAIDGTVTTFAIVSAIAGAGLRSEIAIIMGLANLFGDGFSMAAGNYLRVRSDQEILEEARQTEELHIEKVPKGEIEEIR